MSSSSTSATATTFVSIASAVPSVHETVRTLQARVSEMETEIAILKAANARLKKYENQVIAMKYGEWSNASMDAM